MCYEEGKESRRKLTVGEGTDLYPVSDNQWIILSRLSDL